MGAPPKKISTKNEIWPIPIVRIVPEFYGNNTALRFQIISSIDVGDISDIQNTSINLFQFAKFVGIFKFMSKIDLFSNILIVLLINNRFSGGKT